MAVDPIVGAPLLEEGQASAELDVNEAHARIVAGTISVTNRGLTTPPGSPVNFESHIVGTSATGAWSGQDAKIAIWLDGWVFMTPTVGMQVWDVANFKSYVYQFEPADSIPSWHTLENYAVLTDAATVAWDLSRAQTAILTIPTNRAMGQPTKGMEGRMYRLAITQGAGSLSMTWHSSFKWPAGTPVALSGVSGALDFYEFVFLLGNMWFLNHKGNLA